jgi:AraC-like DNA-binding protein
MSAADAARSANPGPPRRPLAWDGPYCPYIVAAGDHHRPQPWAIRRRRLPFYLLVASLEGREQISVDGRDHAIPAGGGYLIPPAVSADIGSRAGNRPVWVHFDLAFHPRRGAVDDAAFTADGRPVPQLQPPPREVWGVDLPVPLPGAVAARCARELPGLVARWSGGGLLGVLEATHQLAGLLHALVAAVWPGEPDPAPSEQSIAARLRSAEEVARASLATGFSVEDFAAAAGWSRSRFAAIYQRERGEAPGIFLRRERLRAAAGLLRAPALALAEVARLVGYADATVFGRAFRGEYRITPGRWRRRGGA